METIYLNICTWISPRREAVEIVNSHLPSLTNFGVATVCVLTSHKSSMCNLCAQGPLFLQTPGTPHLIAFFGGKSKLSLCKRRLEILRISCFPRKPLFGVYYRPRLRINIPIAPSLGWDPLKYLYAVSQRNPRGLSPISSQQDSAK